MTNQASRVNDAIDIMHSRYQKNREKILAAEEKHEGATITFNTREIELLKLLISDRIGREHQVWFDVTHDEVIDVESMAYELAGSALREDRLHRLLNKFN